MTKQHTRMWDQERDMDVGLWKKGIGEVEKEEMGGIENERKERTDEQVVRKKGKKRKRGKGIEGSIQFVIKIEATVEQFIMYDYFNIDIAKSHT